MSTQTPASRLTIQKSFGCGNVSVNYAIRFSGPVTPLTARRFRYGVTRPHLPARSFTRYKDAFFPRRFSNNSLPLFLFPSPLPPSLHRPLVPQATLSSTYSPARPPSPHRTDTTRPAGKCRSATADSYSLDASATLPRRPSDPSTPDSEADEASGVLAGHGDLVMRRP